MLLSCSIHVSILGDRERYCRELKQAFVDGCHDGDITVLESTSWIFTYQSGSSNANSAKRMAVVLLTLAETCETE